MLHEIAADVRYALRMLLRRPAFLLGTVASLALGIGANTALFTCVNALMLRPLPVKDPERLVMVYATSADSPGDLFGLSYPNYRDFRDTGKVFSSLLVFRPVAVRLAGPSSVEAIDGEMVSGNYFSALGVRPVLGRGFLPEEDLTPNTHPVVVLSYGLWQRRFGSDPHIVGRKIHLNRREFTVVGVAPRDFHGLIVLGAPELWVPTMMHEELLSGRLASWFEKRDALILNTVGRLAPGVSPEQADAAFKTIARHLEQAYPVDNKGLSTAQAPLSQATIHHSIRRNFVLASGALMTLVGVLLLITCANVANLLLARALERRKEIAVRISIGAGRARLVRQLLVEGLVLSLAGGAVGLPLAIAGRNLLWALRPPVVPASLDVSLDGRVLAFTLGLCLITGLIFGLVPLVQSLHLDLVPSLKDTGSAPAQGGWRRLDLRRLLVVAQVALSFVSLAGAGLFLLSLRQAQRIDPGFDTGKIALAAVDLGPQGYDETTGRAFQEQLMERVAGLPGVRSVALAERVMLDLRGTPRQRVVAEGQERSVDEGTMVRFNVVSPAYFETLGIRILEGRGFTRDDRSESPRVTVVDAAMARRFWPGQSPVGRRIRLENEAEPLEVVGVARNCKFDSLGQDDEPYLYLPTTQRYAPAVTIHVRTDGDPTTVLGALRREVQSLDRGLPVTRERTMEDMMTQSLWAARATAAMLAAFGLLALILAAAGLYSTMVFSLGQRLHEIGIRIALGAQRSSLLSLVLLQGLRLVAAGLGLGVVVAYLGLSRVSGILYGAGGGAMAAFATATLVLLAVSVLATLVPARRALRLQTRIVLRPE